MLGTGNEHSAVVINPCIMYFECIYVFACSSLSCKIVLPLIVPDVIRRSTFYPARWILIALIYQNMWM